MQVEQVTDKQGICIIITFIFGSSLIIGLGGQAKNDAWISGIVGMIMALPMLFVYSRILSLFPGKDLFDLLNITFGKFIGKVISVLYVWYSFHLGSLVLRNFGEFMNIVALPETPMLVSLISIGLVCIFAVRLGVEVIGRTCTYFLPILFFIIIFVQLMGIPNSHLSYLKPVLGNGLIPILNGGFSAFSFPLAETVLFIGVFSSLNSKKSPYRIYYWGVLISGTFITFITARNITILSNMIGSLYFPSYEAVSMISIGEFIQRIEITVSAVFTFGVFLKASICLLAACKGIGKIFNLKDYRSIVIQVGLLMIYFSYIIYDNSMLMKYWAFKVYAYYAFPFQVILPIIIWILAEVKVKKLS